MLRNKNNNHGEIKHSRLNRSIRNVYQKFKNPKSIEKVALRYLEIIQLNASSKPNHSPWCTNLMNPNSVTSRL